MVRQGTTASHADSFKKKVENGLQPGRQTVATLRMKQKAPARLEPPDTNVRRLQAPDSPMRFLRTLKLCEEALAAMEVGTAILQESAHS